MKSSDHEDDPMEDESDDSFIMNDGEDDAGPYAMLLMIVLALTYQFHVTVQSESVTSNTAIIESLPECNGSPKWTGFASEYESLSDGNSDRGEPVALMRAEVLNTKYVSILRAVEFY